MEDPKFLPIEHAVYRQMKPLLAGARFILLCVSGGADSMALFHILYRLRPLISQVPLYACYVHHGSGQTTDQTEYRDKARAFVAAQCAAWNVGFFTNEDGPADVLKSEAELREFRYEHILKIFRQLAGQHEGVGYYLTAHHWDDQLETRLVNLIRGSGLEGARGMQSLRERHLRPLLEVSRKELDQYLSKFDVPIVEDPSNKDFEAFRNWLRQEWLPQLEAYRKGGVRRLALSLETLVKECSGPRPELNEAPWSRKWFEGLGPDDKESFLAARMRGLSCQDFSTLQLRELVKRLDTPRNEHSFTLLKLKWCLNAQHIWIENLQS